MATTSAVGYDILIPWGDTAPQSPTDCDLWFDTTSGILWRWSGGISRWMSQPIRTSMQMVVGVGSGQTLSGTTAGTQVAFLTLPSTNDIYIYRTEVIYAPANVNQDTTNYWTYNDDHTTVRTNGVFGNNYRIVLTTASVVSSTNNFYRISASSTGSPGTLYTNGAVVHYVLLY